MRQPKDLVVIREYEPDMKRMVKALQILLEWNPKGGEKGGQGSEPERMEAKGTQNTDTKAG